MNGTLKKLLCGGVITAFLAIFGWCLNQVSVVPSVYATKEECIQVKTDIKEQLSEMRKGFNKRQDRLDEKIDDIHDLLFDFITNKENKCTCADGSGSMN